MKQCTSRLRDKNHRCVDCGREVFDDIADCVFLDEGKVIHTKKQWVTGHV